MPFVGKDRARLCVGKIDCAPAPGCAVVAMSSHTHALSVGVGRGRGSNILGSVIRITRTHLLLGWDGAMVVKQLLGSVIRVTRTHLLLGWDGAMVVKQLLGSVIRVLKRMIERKRTGIRLVSWRHDARSSREALGVERWVKSMSDGGWSSRPFSSRLRNASNDDFFSLRILSFSSLLLPVRPRRPGFAW